MVRGDGERNGGMERHGLRNVWTADIAFCRHGPTNRRHRWWIYMQLFLISALQRCWCCGGWRWRPSLNRNEVNQARKNDPPFKMRLIWIKRIQREIILSTYSSLRQRDSCRLKMKDLKPSLIFNRRVDNADNALIVRDPQPG